MGGGGTKIQEEEKKIENKEEKKILLKEEKKIIEPEIEKQFEDSMVIEKEKEDYLLKKGKSSTCQIIKDKENVCSGFFCKIPFGEKEIKCLITSNIILNEESIKLGNKIKYIYKDKEKILEINFKRFIRFNKELKYILIEILNEDKIEDFFEVENNNINYNNINKVHEEYKNKQISIIQNKGYKIFNGYLKTIKTKYIYHTVTTYKNSSGYPILKLDDFKVIGFHFQYNEKINFNLGIFIYNIIEDISHFNNSIICEHYIKKNNDHYYNEEIQIINHNNNNQYELNECILFLNNKIIPFNWNYEFEKFGKNIIIIKSNKLLTNISRIFFDCSSLTHLNFSTFNTNNVNDMSEIFSGCLSLISLNVYNIKTDNVTNMKNMFFNCSSLTSLNLSNFNTNNVTNMSDMFYNCSSLTNLTISNFNTEKVNLMRNMFFGCSSLTSLNLSNFNTNNVNNMENMFCNCSSLTSLNLSNFNTNNVWMMSGMFKNCSSLKSLNLSSFNTINVKDMSNMFCNCSSLVDLNLSNFNTQNVWMMNSMFFNCSKLTSLNLNGFNCIKLTYRDTIFHNINHKCKLICNDDKILSVFKKNISKN